MAAFRVSSSTRATSGAGDQNAVSLKESSRWMTVCDGAPLRTSGPPGGRRHVGCTPLMAPAASDPPESLADALRRASERLARVGVPDPVVDAELLVGHVLGAGRGAVQAAADPRRRDRLRGRRARSIGWSTAGPPASRSSTSSAPRRSAISSSASAPGSSCPAPRPRWSRSSRSTRSRPRHPLLRSPSISAPGSGAIALALATEVPHARVHAAENSVDAFVWTEENFRAVGADNARLAFVDLADAFPELDGTVSVRRLQPAVCSGCRDPARPGGALLRPARGPLRRRGRSRRRARAEPRRAASAAPRRHDRDRARRVAGRAHPRPPHRRRLARARRPTPTSPCATARRRPSGP